MGRPKKGVNKPEKAIKKPTTRIPSEGVRYDLHGHLPTYTTRGRCKHIVKKVKHYLNAVSAT